MNAPTMFQAAQRIGRAVRMIHTNEGNALGGGRPPTSNSTCLFCSEVRSRASECACSMVYSAGNFIECTTDTPICRSASSTNTAKPVLDRAVTYGVDL